MRRANSVSVLGHLLVGSISISCWGSKDLYCILWL
jgi:hypothetical protein